MEKGSCMKKKKVFRGGVAVLSLLIAACSSTPITVTTTFSEDAKDLGPTEGRACGSMMVLSTAYYFIPVGFNSRVEKAYNRALEKKPGAKSLVNVTMQEDWYWWVLGTARCVTVKGEAVQ
jgi:hypothetical protein